MNHREKLFLYQLDFFRLGLYLSLIQKEAVIQWADQQLLANRFPEQEIVLVDLSLSQQLSKKELSAFITEIIGPAHSTVGSRLLLGLLYKLQDFPKTTSDLEDLLPVMQLSAEEEDQMEELWFNFKFDRHYYPMTMNDIQRAQQEALNFLQLYQDYTLANLEQLSTLEANLELKLRDFLKKTH